MIFGTGKFRVDLEHYWLGKREISNLATAYVNEIDKEGLRQKTRDTHLDIHPTICFSRNIGVGALDVANIIGEKLNYRVLDREIMEYICRKTQLSRESITTFDERYPGRVKEFMCRLLGDTPFDMQDYARQLFIVSYYLAQTEPTIFVGRGVHLMLPRSMVFAVRCISSKERRIGRIAESLNISLKDSENTLGQADMEQAEYFRRVHGKETAAPSEFDLVLNFDYISDPELAADVVMMLFRKRFPRK